MKDSMKWFSARWPHAFLGSAVALALVSMAMTDRSERQDDKRTAKAVPVALALDDKPVERDGKFGVSFAPLVKKIAPSVVKVTTTTKAKETSLRNGPGFDNPWLRRFFGDEDGPNLPQPRGMPRQ